MNSVFGYKNRKTPFIRRSLICAVCAVILVGLFIFPLNAFALNSDYMNYRKWMNNDKVSVYPINYENAGNTLNGYFKFYTDSNLAVYTDFEINESSLSDGADSVYVTYDFHMADEDYSVTVDKNGLLEGSNEQGKSIFKAEADFDNGGTYLSAVEYVGGQYSACYIDVTLNVNGHNYKITKNGKLYGRQLYMELPTTVTTTKVSTVKTTAKKDKKTTAKKTEKAKTTAVKNGAAARANGAVTKFKPKYKYTATAAQKQENKTNNNAAADNATAAVFNNSYSDNGETKNADLQSARGKTEINPEAKRFFPLLIIIIAAGVTVLVIGAVKNKKETARDEKENLPDDTEEC